MENEDSLKMGDCNKSRSDKEVSDLAGNAVDMDTGAVKVDDKGTEELKDKKRSSDSKDKAGSVLVDHKEKPDTDKLVKDEIDVKGARNEGGKEDNGEILDKKKSANEFLVSMHWNIICLHVTCCLNISS